jgi:hypothetical protein
MARWEPKDNEPVGAGENIGRRLFDEPKLSGAPDQRPFSGLDIRNFEESRDREFSIDRLGRSSVDKAVVRYLRERAEHHGTTKFQRPKRFDGWAHISARKLIQGMQCALHPSPIRDMDGNGSPVPWSDYDLEQNKYHAHVLIPADMGGDLFAYEIREQFQKFGDVHRIRAVDSKLMQMGFAKRVREIGKEFFRRLRP